MRPLSSATLLLNPALRLRNIAPGSTTVFTPWPATARASPIADSHSSASSYRCGNWNRSASSVEQKCSWISVRPSSSTSTGPFTVSTAGIRLLPQGGGARCTLTALRLRLYDGRPRGSSSVGPERRSPKPEVPGSNPGCPARSPRYGGGDFRAPHSGPPGSWASVSNGNGGAGPPVGDLVRSGQAGRGLTHPPQSPLWTQPRGGGPTAPPPPASRPKTEAIPAATALPPGLRSLNCM